jgi:hypothetical protein
MASLVFNAKDVLRIVEHSLAAKEQQRQVVGYDKETHALQYATPEAPAVMLVHDDGVYLMSNGIPRDLRNPGDADGHAPSYVAYAKGCNPGLNDDWWDTSRALVGGDDFAETLPWANEIKARIEAGRRNITFTITSNGIALR